MSKHTDSLRLLKQMTEALSKAVKTKPEEDITDMETLDKSEDVEKALKAATASGLGREYRLHQFRAGAALDHGVEMGTLRQRNPHEPPVVPVRHVDTPMEVSKGVEEFAPCNSCGVVCKSANGCPRCRHAHSITEPPLPVWRR